MNEELEKYKFNNDSSGSVKDYESLLQKLEQNIREHISIEHQLKIQCEKYAEKAEKLDLFEEEKIILLSQIVRYIFIYTLYIYVLGWWKKRIQRTNRRFNKANWWIFKTKKYFWRARKIITDLEKKKINK